MRKVDMDIIRVVASMLRVVSHPDRLRLVEALEHQKKTVSELIAELRLSQVTVSKHLAALKRRGIVRSERQANFRMYSISYPNVLNILNCVRQHGGEKR